MTLYQVTRSQIYKHISWIWWGLPIGAAISFLGIKIYPDFFSIIFLALGTSFWVPGLIIHFQYLKDNDGLVINLSPEDDAIKVTSARTIRQFNKNDIEEILYVCTHGMSNWSHGNRLPWRDYGFTQILFKSGQILNLTSLLIDQSSVMDNFKGKDFKKRKAEELFPTLKKRSSL